MCSGHRGLSATPGAPPDTRSSGTDAAVGALVRLLQDAEPLKPERRRSALSGAREREDGDSRDLHRCAGRDACAEPSVPCVCRPPAADMIAELDRIRAATGLLGAGGGAGSAQPGQVVAAGGVGPSGSPTVAPVVAAAQ